MCTGCCSKFVNDIYGKLHYETAGFFKNHECLILAKTAPKGRAAGMTHASVLVLIYCNIRHRGVAPMQARARNLRC